MGYDRIKNIVYISGTRADYGLMRRSLTAIDQHPALSLSIIATGMHLMPEYGYTIKEIEADGFNTYRLEAGFDEDDRFSMANYVGVLTQRLSRNFQREAPDLILLLGDRGEMLAGATVGTYMGIPCAHIHGGEVSGTVDEAVRHAVSKLSHIHFPANAESAERLIKLGENKDSIFVVGAPGLDGITDGLLPMDELKTIYPNIPDQPFAIFLFHPQSESWENAGKEAELILNSLLKAKIPSVILYPNADAGGKKIIEAINKKADKDLFTIIPHLPRLHFRSILDQAALLIGNSSAGIIEAASFHLPVINIGDRQKGRMRAENVLDCAFDQDQLIEMINRCLNDQKLLHQLHTITNPYGDGHAAEKIAGHLAEIFLSEELTHKQISY